jgi:hypothetical protein
MDGKQFGNGKDIQSVIDDINAIPDRREREDTRRKFMLGMARHDDLTGFVFYCLYVHGWRLTPHLREWARMLIAGERVCIVAPPDSGKTRLLRAWCEWAIGLRRDRAIMVIGNTVKQAKKVVWAVGMVISHSPRYKEVFPDVKPTDNWAMDSITVERSGCPMEFRMEATLSGFGIDGAYQGVHVDDIIIDDPTDQKDVNSPPTMLMQREQLTGVLYDRLKEGGNLFSILTRWADDDLAPTLEQIGITIKSYPAYRDAADPYSWDTGPFDDDEHPVSLLCATWLNWTQLEEKRFAKKDDLFKLTFMNQTEGAVRGVKVFPLLDKAKHYISMQEKGYQFIKVVAKRMGADWGTTIQHQSAMVVVTRNTHQQIWVRAAWMSPSGSSIEMGEKAAEWKERFGVNLVHYDRTQGSLKDMFEQLGITPFKGENSVHLRIGALRTLLEHDLFYVDMTGEGTQKLWSQIVSYRYDEVGNPLEVQDDLVDALLYAVFAILEVSRQGVGPMHEIVPTNGSNKYHPYDPDHDDFDPAKEMMPTVGPDISKRRTTMTGYGKGV